VQYLESFLSEIAKAVDERPLPGWDGPSEVAESWSGRVTKNLTEDLERLKSGIARYEGGDPAGLRFSAESLRGLSKDMESLYWEWMPQLRLERTQDLLDSIVGTADCLERRVRSDS
jgi:hypothetical protein